MRTYRRRESRLRSEFQLRISAIPILTGYSAEAALLKTKEVDLPNGWKVGDPFVCFTILSRLRVNPPAKCALHCVSQSVLADRGYHETYREDIFVDVFSTVGHSTPSSRRYKLTASGRLPVHQPSV